MAKILGSITGIILVCGFFWVFFTPTLIPSKEVSQTGGVSKPGAFDSDKIEGQKTYDQPSTGNLGISPASTAEPSLKVESSNPASATPPEKAVVLLDNNGNGNGHEDGEDGDGDEEDGGGDGTMDFQNGIAPGDTGHSNDNDGFAENDNAGGEDESTVQDTRFPEGQNNFQKIFWGPFSNSGSARGFVDYVHRVTGLNVAVVEGDGGGFFAAFHYEDISEIPTQTALIESMTGLTIQKEIQK